MAAKGMIYGNPVPGYPSIMAVVPFLGGLQLRTLGVIGEYLGRVFSETKGRPPAHRWPAPDQQRCAANRSARLPSRALTRGRRPETPRLRGHAERSRNSRSLLRTRIVEKIWAAMGTTAYAISRRARGIRPPSTTASVTR